MLPPHKQLLDYLPPMLRNIREFREIAATEQREAGELWNSFDEACQNLFLLTATEDGLARYERPLGIVPKGTATPEDRRFVLLARYNEQLPFTRRTLKRQLENLCGVDGYTLTIDPAGKTASVLVALTAKSNYDEVANLLERVLPCNMAVLLGLKYNRQETLNRYTHAQLAAWSHDNLRNEVLS